MTFRYRLACAALSLVAVALLVSDVRADERPIRLHRGDIFVEIDNQFRVNVSGEGTISHMGLSAISGSGSAVPLGHRMFETSGELFVIAADGDILYALFTGTLSKNEFGDLGFADLTVTFIGGTGRFSDAVGSAELLFSYDSLTGESDSSFDGTIDY